MSEGNQGQGPENPTSSSSENSAGQQTTPQRSSGEGFKPTRRQPTETQDAPSEQRPVSREEFLRMLDQAPRPEGLENFTPEMLLERIVLERASEAARRRVNAQMYARGLGTPQEMARWAEEASHAQSPSEMPLQPGSPGSLGEVNDLNVATTDEKLNMNAKIAAENQEYLEAARQAAESGRMINSFDRDINELEDESRRLLLEPLITRYGSEDDIPPQVLRDALKAHKGDYEVINIRTEVGVVSVEWPKSIEGKLYRVGKVMNQLETYEEGSDAPGLGPRYREVEGVVTSLLFSTDPERKKQGEFLRTEEKARIALHSGFLGFKLAEHIDKVRDALQSTVWVPHITWALQQDSIIEALQYYEIHAKRYIKKATRDTDELKAFHKDAEDHLEEHIKKYKEKTESLKKEGKISEEEYRERRRQLGDHKSARIIAERIWQFTGRMAAHDWIEVDSKGQWDFVGDAKGGAFQMRRLIKFNEWMFTQYGDNWYPELISNVDLETPDWFEFNASKLAKEDSGFYTLSWDQLHGHDNYHRDAKGYPMTAEELAREENERKKGGLERKVTLVDFRKPDWKNIKYAELTERPFDFWTYRKLAQPEAARRKLVEEHGFLKDPSPENLWKVADVLSYLGLKHWTNNEHLLNNLLYFLENENWDKQRKPNISFARKDRIIQDAVRHHLIHVDRVKPVENRQLGPSWWKNTRRFFGLFDLFKMFEAMLGKTLEHISKISV